MKPDYQGHNWAVYNADCVELLMGLPNDSVDCSVFSSPFSSLYIYSDSERDMGNSASHDEFLQHHAYMARELFRVMKPGTVICDHVKDTVFYQNSSETGEGGLFPFSDAASANYRQAGFCLRARVTIWRDPVREMQKTKHERLLYKNIRENSRVSAMGMPEYILVMRKESKGKNVGEPVTHTRDEFSLDQWQQWASPVWMDTMQTKVLNSRFKADKDEKHICPMPLDLIERCLTLYSNPGDLVLDPFNGIGSTGYQAVKMGRRYIGVELKPEYARQAARFLESAAGQPVIEGIADLDPLP
ncbi:MAG: site-specific DNA-methyltransferase [Betaproteobacteria bacterium]|nr:site-specific DNA-methyltransferase [Betaproteobacteria bacterium]